jgi:hypothetical protein
VGNTVGKYSDLMSSSFLAAARKAVCPKEVLSEFWSLRQSQRLHPQLPLSLGWRPRWPGPALPHIPEIHPREWKPADMMLLHHGMEAAAAVPRHRRKLK